MLLIYLYPQQKLSDTLYNMSLRRINKELKNPKYTLVKQDNLTLTWMLTCNNAMHEEPTTGLQVAAANSFDGVTLHVKIVLSAHYPFKSPNVYVMRGDTGVPVYHPCVEAETGKVCTGTETSWTPSNTMSDLVDIAHARIMRPTTDQVLNKEAMEHFSMDY